MPTVRNYLLGKGEELTEVIPLPPGGGPGSNPYTMKDAKFVIGPEAKAAAEQFATLPFLACPQGQAVGVFTLHPKYLSKSQFPGTLFGELGLHPLGSKPVTVTPRKSGNDDAPHPTITTEIFVAGDKDKFARFAKAIRQWNESSKVAGDFIKIEHFRALSERDRIKGEFKKGVDYILEVVIHAGDDQHGVLTGFVNYAASIGITVDLTRGMNVDELTFLPVKASGEKVDELAKFSFIRVIREMPRIRQPLCGDLSKQHAPFTVTYPKGGPRDPSIKAGVFDGDAIMIPEWENWVTCLDAPGVGKEVHEFVRHGVGVTSAILFGPIEQGQALSVPYAKIDHWRVLDERAAQLPQEELYPVLRRIATVLKDHKYDYVVLCVGPYTPVEDDDVHLWTIVIDKFARTGVPLFVIAAGNTGEGDAILGFNRIQPPADSVNGFSVGASNTAEAFFCQKAIYSSVGPGRSPGFVKPDAIAFGGVEERPFWGTDSANPAMVTALQGTSFAAPNAARMALAIRAHLGPVVTPLAVKAILTHHADLAGLKPFEAGWGLLSNELDELLVCPNGIVHVLYQGLLNPKTCLRAPIPFPAEEIPGDVELSATICYATDIDPQDPIHYTQSGLNVVFRPDKTTIPEKRKTPLTETFFAYQEGMTEAELRKDAHKWETTMRAKTTILGSDLKDPCLDIHFIPRKNGMDTLLAKPIPYAMVISVKAPKLAELYNQIWNKYQFVLKELKPIIDLPIRT